MRIARFHVSQVTLGPAELEGEEHVHLARVLRLRPGAEIELFDGRGQAGSARVVEVGRRATRYEVLALRGADPEPWDVVACVATPKAKRAKRVVEALSELGVSEFAPLECERSEGRPPKAEELERWVVEACKQARRDRCPRIGAPLTPARAAERVAAEARLGLMPDTIGAVALRDALPAAPRPLLFVIGPEGGFTPEERALLDGSLRPVSLGPWVLRVETAAEALLAGAAAVWGLSKGGAGS